jgi:hypothetical protein
MGFIKEPKGIDFVINSGELSDSDREEISRYIREYTLKMKASETQNSMKMFFPVLQTETNYAMPCR